MADVGDPGDDPNHNHHEWAGLRSPPHSDADEEHPETDIEPDEEELEPPTDDEMVRIPKYPRPKKKCM